MAPGQQEPLQQRKVNKESETRTHTLRETHKHPGFQEHRALAWGQWGNESPTQPSKETNPEKRRTRRPSTLPSPGPLAPVHPRAAPAAPPRFSGSFSLPASPPKICVLTAVSWVVPFEPLEGNAPCHPVPHPAPVLLTSSRPEGSLPMWSPTLRAGRPYGPSREPGPHASLGPVGSVGEL